MKWSTWDRIETLLDQYGVQPILAVVPANQDAKLMADPPNPDFWDRARAWQEKGWIIGLHGYRHLFDSNEQGLVPWWPQSEFAGHPYAVQQERVTKGVGLLRKEGLEPRIWVAPGHSFDDNTITALHQARLKIISDGWGWRPFHCTRGMVWIPAQPWRPPLWRCGTWTNVLHHNLLGDLISLESLLQKSRAILMGRSFDFEDLLIVQKKTAADSVFEKLYSVAFSIRRLPQQTIRRRRKKRQSQCRCLSC